MRTAAGTEAGVYPMVGKTGRHAILEQLLADGIRYLFGNPGTVEQGFLDALADYPELQYILALQETIAVGIADGYARATRRPTVVQLHSGVGLGNGIAAAVEDGFDPLFFLVEFGGAALHTFLKLSGVLPQLVV